MPLVAEAEREREGYLVVKQVKLKRFSDRLYGRHEEEERSRIC